MRVAAPSSKFFRQLVVCVPEKRAVSLTRGPREATKMGSRIAFRDKGGLR